MSYKYLHTQLRDDKRDKLLEEFKQLQQDYNIRNKKNYLSQFSDFRKGTAQTLNFMDKYNDYFEKYKNLINWEDPQMTYFFCVVLILGFLFVTFMPLRIFLIISYTYKFRKGITWNLRRQTNNREVCLIELEAFLSDNKILWKDPKNKKSFLVQNSN